MPSARGRGSLFVTPESGDFLQAGGLGDVSAALPRALRRDCDARVLLPGYRPALRSELPIDVVAHLPGAGAIPPCSIGKRTMPDGLVVYLVLCSELYDRDGTPYAGADGVEFGDNATPLRPPEPRRRRALPTRPRGLATRKSFISTTGRPRSPPATCAGAA